MRDEPTKHRQEYQPKWNAAVNRFTAEFIRDFCQEDGSIDWEKLVQLVSAEQKPRRAFEACSLCKEAIELHFNW